MIDDVRNGHGWIIELVAEAGVGKSRLVEELVQRSGDIVLFRARCEEYEASTPYFALRAPMRTALRLPPEADSDEVEGRLREVVARVDPGLEPWIPLLGLLLGLDLPLTPQTKNLDARFLREQLADVAMRFLVSTLAGSPTMLVVEDVHFMDEASADLLTRFSRAGSSLRQVLLVTHSYPGKSWAPVDSDLRCLSICLLPQPTARMVEMVELATEESPLSPHKVEEIAAAREGTRYSSSSCSRPCAPPVPWTHFPTRSSRSSQERSTGSRRRTGRCFATHRCSVRASIRSCSPPL